MNQTAIGRVKYACYSANVTMSVASNLSPVLFLTFRELYDISFSLLGLLVLVNFLTQLAVDLVFSFFSHRFDIPRTVKAIPAIAALGLLMFALSPVLFADHVYIGLLIGTVIFSAAAGFVEVLISPVIAALPAKDPDREMSKLHSVYAWGTVGVIIVSTLFLLLVGNTRWPLLVGIFTLVPICSLLLFAGAEIPVMQTPARVTGAISMLRDRGVWLCVLAIFLGGAAECTMAQWCSGYLESALGIPKIWGDLLGVALFSVMLGLGRTLYAKRGKHILRVLTLGFVGATVCYLTAALVGIPAVGLVACALTGLCTSMLWPGNLVVASDRYPSGGVFIYAIMAAGGDFGASVVPQLLGIVADTVIAAPRSAALAATWGISVEQLGMKAGMLCSALFPLAGAAVLAYMWRRKKGERCEYQGI